MRILITGGAGFVGSNLALAFHRAYPDGQVDVLDNLRRRGSEVNLERFKRAGIRFHHGDIRHPADLEDLPGSYDLLIEASAEPSVQAGLDGSPAYVLDTNLTGTLNCLEFGRKRAGALVFLSTSRVYSIEPLRQIGLDEAATRFEVSPEQAVEGITEHGISERFPTHLPRSLYGATKLASEMIIQEYVASYGMRAVINRCGVIAGPGQFGKVDQGVFTYWVANHHFGRPLRYTGFGGEGKQVRDLLHPDDLFTLLLEQLDAMERISGDVFNVGGGRRVSVSLRELTDLCRDICGREVAVGTELATSPVDIPLYISDHRKASDAFSWKPERSIRDIVTQIAEWIRNNEEELRPIFA